MPREQTASAVVATCAWEDGQIWPNSAMVRPCLHGPPWGYGGSLAGNPAHRIEVPQHRDCVGGLLPRAPPLRRETAAGLSRRREPQL